MFEKFCNSLSTATESRSARTRTPRAMRLTISGRQIAVAKAGNPLPLPNNGPAGVLSSLLPVTSGELFRKTHPTAPAMDREHGFGSCFGQRLVAAFYKIVFPFFIPGRQQTMGKSGCLGDNCQIILQKRVPLLEFGPKFPQDLESTVITMLCASGFHGTGVLTQIGNKLCKLAENFLIFRAERIGSFAIQT